MGHPPQHTNVPLSEFFSLPINSPRAFTAITTEEPYCYFQNKCQYDPSWTPEGPDDDKARIFGTTSMGGTYNWGVAFKITP